MVRDQQGVVQGVMVDEAPERREVLFVCGGDPHGSVVGQPAEDCVRGRIDCDACGRSLVDRRPDSLPHRDRRRLDDVDAAFRSLENPVGPRREPVDEHPTTGRTGRFLYS